MKPESKFIPKSGQVDFTNIRWAPVVNCVVQYQDKILLVKRSQSMRLYPGFWNGISGFLDDNQSLQEKVETELQEELGISKDQIDNIFLGQVFDQDAPDYNKTWIVHPILVKIKRDHIKLDWEATEYQWITFSDALKLDNLLPGFQMVLGTLRDRM